MNIMVASVGTIP